MSGVDPFDVPGLPWTRVSNRLTLARRLVAGSVLGILLAVLVVLAWFAASWVWGLVGGVLVVTLWVWWLIPRQVQALGYAERDEDLLVVRGVLFRTLLVVPYGRMQYVDVQAGPLGRWLGIATVELHTASTAMTDASIPGLTPAEAARLRDRLATRGRARLAGL